MLRNILEDIREILNEQLNIPTELSEKVLELFTHYQKDMWVYPGVIKGKTGMSTDQVYALLTEMEDNEILESFYELYCGNCQKTNGKVHVFNEIPEEFECEYCHEQFTGLENAALIYKVLRDE